MNPNLLRGRAGVPPLRYSELKHMRDSPAHYRWNLDRPLEPWRSATVKSVLLARLFGGQKIAVYEGRRRGAEWEKFLALHAAREDRPGDLICTASEHESAEGMAQALRADPVASALFAKRKGRTIRPRMEWDWAGRRCASEWHAWEGVDMQTEEELVIIKMMIASSVEEIERTVTGSAWHAELAFHQTNTELASGTKAKVVCVEETAPYCVTVATLLPDLLEEGASLIGNWVQTLSECEASDEWPGYVSRGISIGLVYTER